MLRIAIHCCLPALLATWAPASEPDADHAALRALLPVVTEALNTQRLDALGPLLAPGATLVFVDQTAVHSVTELKATFARWLGPDTDLAGVTFAPAIDGPARISGDTALATGTSQDAYRLKNGTNLTMPTRWSATLLRQDGQWRLASLHCGVNLVDNPILDTVMSRAQQATQRLVVLVGLAALIVGLVAGLLIARRRAAPAP